MNQNPTTTRPYAPSLHDRLMDFVERLPFPYYLTYMALFLLQNILLHALAWSAGWMPAFTFQPFLFAFPLWVWGPLALMTHLKRVALEALSDFSPLLEADGQQQEKLKVEFTTMPAMGGILNGVAWVIFYLVLIYPVFKALMDAYGMGDAFSTVVTVEGLFSFAIGSAIFYQSFRQLRLVNLTVKMVRQFNLFQLNPVYSFSRLTSQIGVAWIIMLSLTLLSFPLQRANVPVLAMLALQAVLAAAAFVLPLLFVNHQLVAEKRRLLAEHNRRVEATLELLHSFLDSKESDQPAQLNSAISGLNLERTVLIGIPTWPWRANTLTSFLTTLGLPIIIYLIQLLIKNLLGV